MTLAVGANVIKAVVTAEDTTTMKTYMVTVTREDTTSTCLTPNNAGRMQIWTGTVTVGANESGGTVYRYGFGPDYGALDFPQFSVGVNNYTVDRASVEASASTFPGRLVFSLTSELAAADRAQLTLHVCDAAFAFADAVLSTALYHYLWDDGLDWSSDTSRTLYLSVPGDTTTAPEIVTDGVQVTSTPMATGDTYGLGETIAITVTFDKPVTVDTSGGTRRPGIAFRLDGDLNQNRWAGYSSGSGGTALVFTYMVQAGDMDDDGIRLPANTIELFRGTIRDATDTIVDATLTYAQPGIQSGHKVDGSLTTTTNEDDGTDEDDGTTSPPTGTGGGGGGGGSSGPSLTVPGAPTNLMAVGGDGQVVLTWEAPASDGGTAITDYEVRINQTGEWISIGSTDTTHAVTGLVNGTAYAFQVRAVNAAGSSAPSNQTEATPELFTLDFAHFANGEGITSDLVFVNVATHPIRLGLDFYDKEGNPIAAETVVDATEDLEITEDGALSVRTAMEPLGELTISTHGQGEVVSGSVKVVSNGPIGGVLRFDLPGIGVAGVGASPPVRDALFPARREGGGISTAAAIHNIEEEAIVVSCRLMSGGVVLEAMEISLEANGQEAQFIEEMFTTTDTSNFVGLVRCTGPGRFTGVAVELDASNQIFTTLPVVPVERAAASQE